MSALGIALLLFVLVGAAAGLGVGIGIRKERGRYARWEQVNVIAPRERELQRGTRLRSIRLRR